MIALDFSLRRLEIAKYRNALFFPIGSVRIQTEKALGKKQAYFCRKPLLEQGFFGEEGMKIDRRLRKVEGAIQKPNRGPFVIIAETEQEAKEKIDKLREIYGEKYSPIILLRYPYSKEEIERNAIKI